MSEWATTAAFGAVLALVGIIWRDLVKRVDSVSALVCSTDQAVLKTRVDDAHDEIDRLRKFRHEKIEPYIYAMDSVNKRIESLERVRNGKLS